ncbi:MAG: hypothetical protein ACSNEK_00080 [Parachlamydiaceae bacterium]
MRKFLLTICLCMIQVCSINAWTFSPKSFLTSGNLDDLFQPTVLPHHQQVINAVFEVVNVGKDKWVLENEPKDYDNQFIITFIPSDHQTRFYEEQIVFSKVINQYRRGDQGPELTWETLKDAFGYPKECCSLIKQNNEDDFEFKMALNLPRFKDTRVGKSILRDNGDQLTVSYYIKGRVLSDEEISSQLAKLNKIIGMIP